MPHWLTPVCDDHPVSQPTSRWLPSRIHRCNVGTSPELIARRSTARATPSSWMNTMPGASLTSASFERRRACRAMRWSNHESSSTASRALTNVVTITSPTTTHNAVQNPSISTPGSTSSSRNTNSALRTIAPSPSVSTDSGTTRNASAGQTTALAMPTTKPASRASHNESIEKPGRMAASNHNPSVVTTVTTMERQRTVRHDGRSAAGRTTREVDAGVIRRPQLAGSRTGSLLPSRSPLIVMSRRSKGSRTEHGLLSSHRASRRPSRHHTLRVIRHRVVGRPSQVSTLD